MKSHQTVLRLVILVLLTTAPSLFGTAARKDDHFVQTPPRSPLVHRERKDVDTIFPELGDIYVERAYRMKRDSFFNLHRLLYCTRTRGLKGARPRRRRRNLNVLKEPTAPNGIITSTARLSMALRFFAGGAPYDIAVVHGVSVKEVYRSVWRVVNSVNQCDELAIKFPNLTEQETIANGFKKKSAAGFDKCIGAIDGMLVWTDRPNAKQCNKAGCGPKKFFCGRKHKYGLNLQGVCDHHRRFTSVQMCHPASTSDYLAFASSTLVHQLESENFVKKGYCLFGDNAGANRLSPARF